MPKTARTIKNSAKVGTVSRSKAFAAAKSVKARRTAGKTAGKALSASGRYNNAPALKK